MLITAELARAINEQMGNEYGASLQYVSIAAHFEQQKLKLLARLFFEQVGRGEGCTRSNSIHYLLDTQCELRIPAIPAPTPTFASAEDAVAAALKWEQDVTGQITRLMQIAVDQNDYMSQSFLQWFIDEQLEEINKMDQLLLGHPPIRASRTC